MAEIVGLISAVGAIIGAGFKITQAINELCDGFEDAPHNIKSIADDTRILTTLLLSMQARLEKDRRMESEIAKVFGEILARCRADIDKIEASLRPLVENKNSTEPTSPLQRLRWLFAKSKIYSHQASLASLKLNLMLFINTLHLCDGPAVEGLKENILNTVQEKKDIKTAFLKAASCDQAVAKAYDDQTEGQDGVPLSSFLDGPTSAITLTTSVASVDTGSMVLAGLQPQKPAQPGLDIHALPDDDCLMWIVAHIALQRSVINFSFTVIQRDPAPEPVGPAPDSSAPVFGSALPGEPPDSAATAAMATDAGNSEVVSNTEQPADSTAGYDGEDGSDSYAESLAETDTRAQPGEAGGYHGNRQHQETSRPENVPPQRRRRVMPERPRMNSPRESEYYERSPPPPPPSYRGPYNNDPYARDYFYGGGQGGGPRPPEGSPGYYPFGNSPGFPGMAGPSAPYFNQIPVHQAYPQFYQHVAPTPPPPAGPIDPDPEKEAMRSQLQAIKRAQEKREELERQNERESKIRRDAEESFHRRMEEMRRAQEEAKAQINVARIEAERVSREKLEQERIAQEQRRKEQEEERKRAEREAREKIEAELRAERVQLEMQRREGERRKKEFEDSLRRAEREAREKLRDELIAKEEEKRLEKVEVVKRAEGKKRRSLGGLLFGK